MMPPYPIDPRRTRLPATPTTFGLVDGCLPDFAPPGSFELRAGYMILACPGCGHVSGMRVGPSKPDESPSWQLTGPPDAPTLTPSVNCVGCCKWHGFLKAGVFESC